VLDDFMMRAALAGIGVALAAAPLGCFVVWRRMAYFGEATAHAAILGVALSLALQASIFAGALAVAVSMAWIVTHLSGRGYAMDTLLGVLAHSSLAIGLVIVSFLPGVRIDLMAYLFGDIFGRLAHRSFDNLGRSCAGTLPYSVAMVSAFDCHFE
jgi:zinc transport system permease protein